MWLIIHHCLRFTIICTRQRCNSIFTWLQEIVKKEVEEDQAEDKQEEEVDDESAEEEVEYDEEEQEEVQCRNKCICKAFYNVCEK